MIGLLSGEVRDVGRDGVVVLTGGGVGYTVTVSSATKHSILSKGSCTLYTHTVVRSDTIDLFGFLDCEAYSAFLLLISVSGIGPKKALVVLDSVPVQTLLSSIQKEDVDTLVSFGVGKKQAQKMIFELHKKIDVVEEVSSVSGDVLAALIALGYEKKYLLEVFQSVSLGGETVAEQIQESLKIIRDTRHGK